MKSLASLPARYPKTQLSTRAFLEIRYRLTPYDRMAAHLPKKGCIADLGSGHGLFAIFLALQEPTRQVYALDHDLERVRMARSAANDLPHLRFEEGSLLSLPPSADGPFDGISLIDVMHYFDRETQRKILSDCYARLAPGGTLIFREVDPAGGPISHLNRLYERVATLTGFTRTEEKELFFRTPAEWVALLQSLGFKAHSERCSHFLFADVLFVGRKPGTAGSESETK